MLSFYLAALDDSGSEAQFTQVYERCKRLVYYTAYKVVQDSYLAEDVLQDVFLQLAQNFTRVYRDDPHQMAAYLVICAKSRAVDLLRARRETVDEVQNETLADDTSLPEDAVIDAESAARLTALLEKLPVLYKAPLQLKVLGYTNREIAVSLHLTESTVRQRLVRGRKLLWKELRDESE